MMILETLPYFVVAALLFPVIYRLFFHPIRHVPGPFYASISSLFLHTICFLGNESRVIRALHRRYRTPVLRIGPNTVSVADSSAINDIYVSKGGFPKDARYTNFNLGPIVSIFSAIDTDYRDRRAKAVLPLFAPARVRSACAPDKTIGQSIAQFRRQLQVYKTEKIPFDLVDICARLSIDVVTGYLLGEVYGGFAETAHLSIKAQSEAKLSLNPFIFAIVGFSRFSLLPNWLFKQVYRLAARLTLNDEAIQSFQKLDTFTAKIMSRVDAKEDRASISTYQSHLLNAGIPAGETAAQCKAIVFAGADSTAVMLSTILFHLIRNPDMRRTLAAEISARQKSSTGPIDPESIPYLRGVVKEGLRLGMANPTRLTRVVPSSATLQVGGHTLPPGTVVGCAAYTLHHNPEVFPEPFEFRPERWLERGQDEGLGRPSMEKSMMPFGMGGRACIGKNVSLKQLYETVLAVVSADPGKDLLEGARMQQNRIDIIEWFNGEIKGHHLDVDWD